MPTIHVRISDRTLASLTAAAEKERRPVGQMARILLEDNYGGDLIHPVESATSPSDLGGHRHSAAKRDAASRVHCKCGFIRSRPDEPWTEP